MFTQLNVTHAHHYRWAQNTKEVTANSESDTVSRPVAACDTISQDVKLDSESQSTIPAVTKHKGSPKATMDLDYFDGPTVIAAEVC